MSTFFLTSSSSSLKVVTFRNGLPLELQILSEQNHYQLEFLERLERFRRFRKIRKETHWSFTCKFSLWCRSKMANSWKEFFNEDENFSCTCKTRITIWNAFFQFLLPLKLSFFTYISVRLNILNGSLQDRNVNIATTLFPFLLKAGHTLFVILWPSILTTCPNQLSYCNSIRSNIGAFLFLLE